MKKALILILVFLFAASLPGCAARPSPEGPAESGSVDEAQRRKEQTPVPGGPSPEAEGPLSEPEPVGYESRGYVLSLPGDCAGSILVNPADGPEDSPEYALFEVYYKPSYEAARAEGYTGGWLFTIWQLDQARYEQYLSEGDWISEYAFARSDRDYFIMVEPTDLQVWDPGDWEQYEELSEVCRPAAMEAFLRLNGLEAYSDDAFWESRETYGGEHRYFRYYPYRAYPDVETSENKEMYYTLMLSQPATQGNGGIWCVERVYDAAEYGYLYAIFPREEGRTAMEVYAQQQAAADAGDRPELLDPLRVALAFVQARYGHEKATEDSFEEVSGPPEGHFVF